MKSEAARAQLGGLLLGVAMTLPLSGCTSSEVEVRYSLADSCEEPLPPVSDDVEPEFEHVPGGLDYLCGVLLPQECIELDGATYAVLEASDERVDIEFLGETGRLSDRCDTDLGVRIVVVAAEPIPIDPSWPVFFNGAQIDPVG